MSKQSRRLRPGVAGVCVAALPSLVMAQTVAPGSAAEPQRVDIQGGAQQARSAAVGAMVVVTREELMRQGDTRLADALRRVPGLTVVSDGERKASR